MADRIKGQTWCMLDNFTILPIDNKKQTLGDTSPAINISKKLIGQEKSSFLRCDKDMGSQSICTISSLKHSKINLRNQLAIKDMDSREHHFYMAHCLWFTSGHLFLRWVFVKLEKERVLTRNLLVSSSFNLVSFCICDLLILLSVWVVLEVLNPVRCSGWISLNNGVLPV